MDAEELLDAPPTTGLALIRSCGISALDLGLRQALLDGPLDADQADAELVLRPARRRQRTRRLPRWSMSSTSPLPLRRSTRIFDARRGCPRWPGRIAHSAQSLAAHAAR
jgi:hypothetical protein